MLYIQRESAIEELTMADNILYIEDNPDNTTLVRRALEARGYRLLHAETGTKGVSIAESETVSLILLDINLPDIDGYEVARRLRVDRRTQDVPIIFLTEKRFLSKRSAVPLAADRFDFYFTSLHAGNLTPGCTLA